MKKSAFILLILTAMFAITNCAGGGGGGGAPPPPTRKFWAQDFVKNMFYQLDAELLAENTRCRVWVEKGSGVTTAMANNVANTYSNTVYSNMISTFGNTYNVSGLGQVSTMEYAHWLATGTTSGAKLTILLLDIKDGSNSTSEPYIGGYFNPYDLFSDDPKNRSNQLDMIYVDTYPSVPGSQGSNQTLAHEMQHLMNLVSSIALNRSTEMDLWINEGLSTAAEWVYSKKHSEDRLSWYNYGGSELNKGNNFFCWGNRGGELVVLLDDYATAYLFFQYLRLQAQSRDNIYRDIIKSTYTDYRAVTTADSLNSSHKNNWQGLLRDWYAANYIHDTSSLYGYKEETQLNVLTVPWAPTSLTSLSLYPGEGVYSKINGTGTLPGTSGNIKYAGLDGTSVVDSGTASGARLTYNVNTNHKNGPAETGSTTGIAGSVGISIPGSGSVQIDQKEFTGPYKVDASYFRRRNGNDSMLDNEIINLFNNRRSISNDNNTLTSDISTLESVFIDE